MLVVLVALVHISTCTKSTNGDDLLPYSKGIGHQADRHDLCANRVLNMTGDREICSPGECGWMVAIVLLIWVSICQDLSRYRPGWIVSKYWRVFVCLQNRCKCVPLVMRSISGLANAQMSAQIRVSTNASNRAVGRGTIWILAQRSSSFQLRKE